MSELPRLRATEIGEYIRYKSCERRFKLAFNNREVAKKLPFVGRLFRSIDPVLQLAGSQREQDWEKSLKIQHCFVNLNNEGDLENCEQPTYEIEGLSWEEFLIACSKLTNGVQAYVRELQISAPLGAFQVEGRVDFALILWRRRLSCEGEAEASYPVLRLVECKASRRDRTYHRAQLSVYKMIVEKLLASTPLVVAGHVITPDRLECIVARIDEATNTGQNILEQPSLDLTMIAADTLRILSSGGTLERITGTDIDDLHYQLESKCDDCVFNVNCFPESGRQRKLELLGCDPSTVRCLHEAGVKTIDDLAELDLDGDQCSQIIESGNCSTHIDVLSEKAAVRASALPFPTQHRYPVQLISVRTLSQLPPHESKHGERLLRIYMAIDYDYAENRIGALSAHVTSSNGILAAGWTERDESGKAHPDPELQEKKLLRIEDNYKHIYDEGGHPVTGEDVIHLRTTCWSGNYEQDARDEQQMIERFFADIISAIKLQAGDRERISMHFYVWSRLEIARLVEACSRVSSTLTGHLRELLGCREPLEQMIYSCLQDEINARYGLAWTGRGLLVATAVPWFGERYHWTRLVDNHPTRLDRVFSQNLFDFIGMLTMKNGEWVEPDVDGAAEHRFEIRSRFNDSLPAPYWHAAWGTLISPKANSSAAAAIKGFLQAGSLSMLTEYLRARVHALRWIEERVSPRNAAILKSPIAVASLPQFTLRVDSAARAAVDFLRLDHHIKVNDWIATQLVPPRLRLTGGRTIPLRDIRPTGMNRMKGKIDLTGYDISIVDLQSCCTIGERAFVRLSPCQSDPSHPQTINQLFRGGSTCIVNSIDWNTMEVHLSVLPLSKPDRYRLASLSQPPYSEGYQFATLDESPSNFVDIRVDKRLCLHKDNVVCRWFDRVNPELPPANPLNLELIEKIDRLLSSMDTGYGGVLATDQKEAVLLGLSSRVQLLQGPPGTGKTMTTAVAVLTRALCRARTGDCILLAANTHTAIDTLLARVQAMQSAFRQGAEREGLELPSLYIAKVRSVDDGTNDSPVDLIAADHDGLARLQSQRRETIAIVGGTTASLLKLSERSEEFRGVMLIVDEASMMVFPHFLALATLIRPEHATFMLAGDHRQLAPILAHDWEREDRPPTVLYQPYASAYDGIRFLSDSIADSAKISRHALQYTYRLPAEIRNLIGFLYRLDDVELQGAEADREDTLVTNSYTKGGELREADKDSLNRQSTIDQFVSPDNSVAAAAVESNALGKRVDEGISTAGIRNSAKIEGEPGEDLFGRPPGAEFSNLSPQSKRLRHGVTVDAEEIVGKIVRLTGQGNIGDHLETGLALNDTASSVGSRNGVVDPLGIVWQRNTGLFMISHGERESRRNNVLEVNLIERLLLAGNEEIPPGSVAVITPHRAQRTMLQTRLARFSKAVDVIDTVERLQGGERPTVIFSATVSDPSAIASNVEFILDLNRSNVAFSRSKQRLIVICAEELINFIPAELAQYEASLLWKSLRALCTIEHASFTEANARVRILSPR